MNPIIPSFIFSFFPIAYIAGPLLVNINIALFVFHSVWSLSKFKTKIILNKYDILIFILFTYIIIIGIFNSINYIFFNEGNFNDLTVLTKSFLYLRYFALYLSIRLMIEFKLLNTKYLFITALVSVIFVSLDLIYQSIFTKDIFGLISPTEYKLTGPFGDEEIAGSYIQKFSIIAFFALIFFFKLTNIKRNFFLIAVILLFFYAILISGNRMSAALYILSLTILFLSLKNFRKYFIYIFSLVLILNVLIFKFNPTVNDYLTNFYSTSVKIIKIFNFRITGVGNDIAYEERPNYLHEFDSGFGTWKMNKFFGGGIKSFRYNCIYRKHVDLEERFVCNMHPHNYYLEILSDLGLSGLLIILIFLSIAFKDIYINNRENNLSYPFLIFLIIEFFPIRSSGSFFTTNNSSLIFLAMGVMVGLYQLNKLKSEKN